jgi:Tfp pilus assembly pilus retraction ATPase PilT
MYVQNLVKGGKTSFSPQVIDKAAKINMQTMSQSPFATCYSEYIE